jgi:hypothetical protein
VRYSTKLKHGISPSRGPERKAIDHADVDASIQLQWDLDRTLVGDGQMEKSRDQSKAFLSQGVRKELARDMLGVDSLHRRLSKILLDRIDIYVPSLMEDVR